MISETVNIWIFLKKKLVYHNSILFEVWADNGDFLSKQYAGTGALKSDFTRYINQNKRKKFPNLFYQIKELERGLFMELYETVSTHYSDIS